MRFELALLAVLPTFASGCDSGSGGPGDPVTDAESLVGALAAAAPGDTVALAEGSFEGSFTIPAGVTLMGAGRGNTSVVGRAGEVALRIEPAGTPSGLSDLTIVANGDGIVAEGGGEALVERVDLMVWGRIGLAADGLDRLMMTDVSLVGPEDADGLAPHSEPGAGLVLYDVEDAQLSSVSAQRFTGFGAVVWGGSATWIGGEVQENYGVGVAAVGGIYRLEELTITDTWIDASGEGGMGLLAMQGTGLETRSLIVSGNRYGVFHDDAFSATHVALGASENEMAAVWIQNSYDVHVSLGSLEDNLMAGVVALDTYEVVVEGTGIQHTTASLYSEGEGQFPVGDAIQLVRTRYVNIDRVELGDNARVGILLDLGEFDQVNLNAVTVEGTGDQLGVVAQNGELPESWDDGVERQGATAANDAALEDDLPIVGVMGPNCLPSVEGLR